MKYSDEHGGGVEMATNGVFLCAHIIYNKLTTQDLYHAKKTTKVGGYTTHIDDTHMQAFVQIES